MIKTKEFHLSMMKAYEDANYALCKKENADWTADCSSKAATYCGTCDLNPDTLNSEDSCNRGGTCTISGGSCGDSSATCTANCGTCSDSQYTTSLDCTGSDVGSTIIRGTWTAATWTPATWTKPADNDPCCSDGELKCKGTGPKECCDYCFPGQPSTGGRRKRRDASAASSDNSFEEIMTSGLMTSDRRALCTASEQYNDNAAGVAVCGTTGSSCNSCTWTHDGTTYVIPDVGDESHCTDHGICFDSSGNLINTIGDSSSCAASGTWTAAVFTVFSANANNEYACHGNSWIKSCYRCTGAAFRSPTECIKSGGTWALDADSTTEALCSAGSGGTWSFANKFEGGQTVAGASVSAGGIMQPGMGCSTGPSYILGASSCIKDTTFDADIDEGTTGSAAYAANLNYYSSDSGMNGMAGITTYPYVVKAATITASPNLAVDASICFLPFLRPKNEGALFISPDATYGHVLITEPRNYATADKILFSSGKASVLGGTNAGNIEFATDKQVRLWGIVNSGSVKFTLSQDIVIGDVTNSGSIVMTGTKQAIVGVTNEATGTVVGNGAGAYYVYNTVNNGAITINADTVDAIKCNIEDVTNEATGTVVVNGPGAYYVYNVVNKGAVTINAGTVDALIKCNSGTITIGAGVTGTVTIVDGCTGGTITAGGATVVNAVATYASFTISLDGITAAGFTTDAQNSFKEVVCSACYSAHHSNLLFW